VSLRVGSRSLNQNRDGVDFRRPVREQSACSSLRRHRGTVNAELGSALVGQRLGSRGPSLRATTDDRGIQIAWSPLKAPSRSRRADWASGRNPYA